MASSSSSSSSPCAACKFLRRKCTQGCVFAPYFPPDQPTKFANVHRVFGASNVAKLLNDLHTSQREDAVNSLAFEAEARLRDPVYGCVGYISILQHRLNQLQQDLQNARRELSAYVGPAAAAAPAFLSHHQFLQQAPVASYMPAASSMTMMPPPSPSTSTASRATLQTPSPLPHHMLMGDQQQQQQMMEALQLATAAREQELLREHEHPQMQQHQHQQFERYGGRYLDASRAGGVGFGQMDLVGVVSVASPPPELAQVPQVAYDNAYQVVQQHHRHWGQENEEEEQGKVRNHDHHNGRSSSGDGGVMGSSHCSR